MWPKVTVAFSYMMDDALTSHIFKVAKYIINAVLGITGIKSNNIYIANGKEAGQNVAHVLIHIIPRVDGDKAVFRWEGKKIPDNEMEELVSKLNGKIKIKKEMQEVKKENKEEISFDFNRVP